MPRPLRITKGGYVYHVLNRANGRMQIFNDTGDYFSFEKVLAEACQRARMRLLAYCVMPNHWHLVIWPRKDGDLSQFMGWLTMTHTQRWHAFHNTAGSGHLYQGRFKSFIIQADNHFLTVCRYVESNAQRAGLVQKAQDWRWNSLWRRQFGDAETKAMLSAWPLSPPHNWLELVNTLPPEKDLDALRLSVARERPFGNKTWLSRIVYRFGLEATLRSRGRPRKET